MSALFLHIQSQVTVDFVLVDLVSPGEPSGTVTYHLFICFIDVKPIQVIWNLIADSSDEGHRLDINPLLIAKALEKFERGMTCIPLVSRVFSTLIVTVIIYFYVWFYCQQISPHWSL